MPIRKTILAASVTVTLAAGAVLGPAVAYASPAPDTGTDLPTSRQQFTRDEHGAATGERAPVPVTVWTGRGHAGSTCAGPRLHTRHDQDDLFTPDSGRRLLAAGCRSAGDAGPAEREEAPAPGTAG